MRGGCQPVEEVHSMVSMWSVKLRPKTRSEGGRMGLGVLVRVMVRAEGSMAGREARSASWEAML